jgi:hypothetical protein
MDKGCQLSQAFRDRDGVISVGAIVTVYAYLALLLLCHGKFISISLQTQLNGSHQLS